MPCVGNLVYSCPASVLEALVGRTAPRQARGGVPWDVTIIIILIILAMFKDLIIPDNCFAYDTRARGRNANLDTQVLSVFSSTVLFSALQ